MFTRLCDLSTTATQSLRDYVLPYVPCKPYKEHRWIGVTRVKRPSVRRSRKICWTNRKDVSQYIGQRFGRMKALKRLPNDSQGKVMMLCRCQCGTKKPARLCELKDGSVQSCGCLQKEGRIAHSERRFDRLAKGRVFECYMAWKHYDSPWPMLTLPSGRLVRMPAKVVRTGYFRWINEHNKARSAVASLAKELKRFDEEILDLELTTYKTYEQNRRLHTMQSGVLPGDYLHDMYNPRTKQATKAHLSAVKDPTSLNYALKLLDNRYPPGHIVDRFRDMVQRTWMHRWKCSRRRVKLMKGMEVSL